MCNREKMDGKQLEVLAHIVMFVQDKGFAPTVRELCECMGYQSPSTIHHYLKKLQEEGFISYEPSKPRTIAVKKYVHVNRR